MSIDQIIKTPTPLQFCTEINHVKIYIKRDDLTHHEISGNKWRKLKYNLSAYHSGDYKGMVSFGGAYSNHVFSLSSLCRQEQIQLTLFIRGEEISVENPTLAHARACNAEIIKISREAYRTKELGLEYQEFISSHPNYYFIPEGGTNELALHGVHEVIYEIRDQINHFDFLITSMGTGGTAAGFLQKLYKNEQLIVYPALKGSWITGEINSLAKVNDKLLTVRHDYTFGGYAKGLDQTNIIIENVFGKYNLPLDPIYTSKAFHGFISDIELGFYPPGFTCIFYHSGGLQSLKGLEWQKSN
jgi:1-aminocyclopropane-1-carboxylate deaminase